MPARPSTVTRRGRAFADDVVQGAGEQPQLVVPADHRDGVGVLVDLLLHRGEGEPDLGRGRPPAQRHRRSARAKRISVRVASVRRAADEHPAGRRLGLQPGGGVHHVAGDDRLPAVVRRGHVDQRLAGGDADPERPPVRSARPSGSAPVAGRGPARTQRTASVSVATGAPNSTIAASPMYFSTTPPYWRTIRRTVAKKSVWCARTVSGSVCSANGVDPIASMNSTLTRRRSSRVWASRPAGIGRSA